MQALIRFLLAAMICAACNPDLYCQNVACPSLEDRALHLYKIDSFNKKKPVTYFAARSLGTDSLNQWKLYSQSSSGCRLLSDSSFNNIFDFHMVKDSIAMVAAVKSPRNNKDTAELFVYKLFLKRSPDRPDELVAVKELHYFHFDEAGYIGITNTAGVTYFLNGKGDADVTTLDNQPIGNKALYPTTSGGYFIIRDVVSETFILARKQADVLQTIATGTDNAVFVQPDKSVLYKQGAVSRFYPVKADGQPSPDYQFARHFQKGSAFTPVVGADGKWSVISAGSFKPRNVVLPEAGLQVKDVMSIPGRAFTIVSTKGDQSKWFYQDLAVSDTAIQIDEITAGSVVVPVFADFVLIQAPDKSIKILSLTDRRVTELNVKDVSLTGCKLFPLEDDNPTSMLNSKKFPPMPERFLIVTNSGSKYLQKALLVKLNASSQNNKWSLLCEDNIYDGKYFVSLKRFLVLKDDASGFWQVKDLVKFNTKMSWSFSKEQRLVVVRPFEKIGGKFYARAIKRTQSNEEVSVLINIP